MNYTTYMIFIKLLKFILAHTFTKQQPDSSFIVY